MLTELVLSPHPRHFCTVNYKPAAGRPLKTSPVGIVRQGKGGEEIWGGGGNHGGKIRQLWSSRHRRLGRRVWGH